VTAFVLSQLLIGAAFVFDFASFQFRHQRHVLACLAVAAGLIGLHFLVLQYYTAAVLGFLASARFITAMFSSSRKLYSLFMGLVLLNALVTWAGLMTALATLGALLSTTAAFATRDRDFRRIMMLASLFWVVHNALAQTPAAVLLEAVFLCSNLLGYYRFYLRGGGRGFDAGDGD
jgi:hypothetical protein